MRSMGLTLASIHLTRHINLTLKDIKSMPFKKGNQLGKANKGKPKQSAKRTIWLLESLQENGFDYEKVLARLLKSGKPEDMKLAELLIRMVPHIANAPKQDITLDGVETLVINRYADPKPENGSSSS